MQENKEREKVWGFNQPHNQANNELISELFIAKYFECLIFCTQIYTKIIFIHKKGNY